MKNQFSDKELASDEIDLLEVARKVWSYRRTMYLIITCFFFLGVFIAIFSEYEYRAQSTFIPQSADSNKFGGNLGGLASLAGINLGSMEVGSDIPPSLYPKIVASVNFKKELLNALINPESTQAPVTYATFYEEYYKPGLLSTIRKYTLGLPGVILKSLKGSPQENSLAVNDGSMIKLTEKEIEHFKRLDKQISIQHNEKQNIVELYFNMPEPLIAAQMAKYSEALLQKEIIAYKIQNAREQLKFTEERYLEKKQEFESIQNRLARFRDRNQNITSAIALNELDKMEAEFNFSFTIYTEMAKQLEQAKLQVSRDTPIFMIIEPVTMPSQRAAPNRPLIIVFLTIIGAIVAICYIFSSIFFRRLQQKWSQ